MTDRVLFVQRNPSWGSSENYLRDLLTGLDKERFTPVLSVPPTDVLAPFRELGVPVVETPGHGLAERVRRLRRTMREVEADLVHFADTDAVGLLAARAARCPAVVTLHTPELPLHQSWRGATIERLGWWTRPHAIATSESDRRTAIERFPIRATRVVSVPLGVQAATFGDGDGAAVRQELGIPRSAFVVVAVGRLSPQKRLDRLLQMAAALRGDGVHVLIAGDGELREDLLDQRRRLALTDVVHLLGDRTDVPAVLAAGDALVITSAFEGRCYAALEAHAAGLPVVAVRVGGISETVLHERTGFLVPPGADVVEELTTRVRSLVHDPAGAADMGEAGRRRVTALYSVDRMVLETESLYEHVLHRRRAS